MKRLLSALIITLSVLFISGTSFAQADTIGFVDFEKVLQGYEHAQSTLADIKVREAELRKLQADYVKQIEETRKNSPKNPVTANQLEKDLNDKLNARVREYRDWATTQQKVIDQALETSIREVARSKNVDIVLTRQAIFEGGVDLTNDVLTKLNQASARTTTK